MFNTKIPNTKKPEIQNIKREEKIEKLSKDLVYLRDYLAENDFPDYVINRILYNYVLNMK